MGSNSASNAADNSPRFSPDGTPTLVAGRQLLETCRNRQDVIKWFNKHATTIQGIVPICDREGAVVVEVTPQSVVVLEAERGLIYCTNRFRSDKLRAIDSAGRRYSKLAMAERLERLAVADVWKLLHDASQESRTIHTIVFEPDKPTIHVALGDGRTSASSRKMTSVETAACPHSSNLDYLHAPRRGRVGADNQEAQGKWATQQYTITEVAHDYWNESRCEYENGHWGTRYIHSVCSGA
jgi:hypothetical protein